MPMPFYCMITFTLLSKINLMVFSNLGLQEIRRWCSKPPLLGNIVQIGDKSGYSIYRSIKQIDQWKFYFELIPLNILILKQLPYRLQRERTSLMWLPALEPAERCVNTHLVSLSFTGEATNKHRLNLSLL